MAPNSRHIFCNPRSREIQLGTVLTAPFFIDSCDPFPGTHRTPQYVFLDTRRRWLNVFSQLQDGYAPCSHRSVLRSLSSVIVGAKIATRKQPFCVPLHIYQINSVLGSPLTNLGGMLRMPFLPIQWFYPDAKVIPFDHNNSVILYSTKGYRC